MVHDYEIELKARVNSDLKLEQALEQYRDDILDELALWDEDELESAWNGDDEYEAYLPTYIEFELEKYFNANEVEEFIEYIREFFGL